MNGAGFVGIISTLVVAMLGCSPVTLPGDGLLPEGIENAQIPDADSSGYIYFNSESPAILTNDFFLQSEAESANQIRLDEALMVLSTDSRDFGGILDFESQEDANYAWALFQERVESENVWGQLSNPSIALVTGDGTWSESVKSSYESDEFITIKEHDPTGWDLMRSLPQNPPSRPVAAGVLNLERGVIDAIGDLADMELGDISEAFGLVRVHSLAFAFYTDEPLEISSSINREYLDDSNSALIFVSHSAYPSALVSYMLTVMADKTQMELISLGRTNARYQNAEGLHLILKNRGSLLYGAVGANRESAEEIMVSALFPDTQN